MKAVTEKVIALVRTMCGTEEYRYYRRLQRELDKDGELKALVDEFRRDNYERQRAGQDMFDISDQMRHQYEWLLSQPLVRDYLDAENSVCRMVRDVCNMIGREVKVELPE